ncbi:metalloregulator ArsR/SmtB family transcription factor [Modestobacter sp. I12A-02628]|uniref:Metalloregulator ArsR/SmtB family transcription factor n=1 Tax=Goekera deserti TaxID=2497753 RepID=A0A7K3WHY2_9ACTN|nr:metalloregulator ArsR/SmtB family transcription factor [Goekera deserti]MPQ97781.1 metalloregulator ArsR/SmtB family transcription factor [Goekera deserti]NDI48426.1 metalloregulator ArsR/SmtB family transcription factor [Goekera deserti]NEL56027.1 metalloregulator ArsR/SmtB family transcription factor [Goekera deserti]
MPEVDVYAALAHPVRRGLLELLATRPHTAGDLAGRFPCSRTAVVEHLRVLRCAGLVDDDPVGRKRLYQLRPGQLGEVARWAGQLAGIDVGRTAPTRPPGDAHGDADRAGVTAELTLAAAPAAVWRALTDPVELARWWITNDVADRVGHRFHLGAEPGRTPCEVIVCEPPSRFAFRMEPGWTVDWRLQPSGAGTRLLLAHGGFDLHRPEDRTTYIGLAQYWQRARLPRLAALLETTGPGRHPTDGELRAGPGRD